MQVEQRREVGPFRRQQELRPSGHFLEAFVGILLAGEAIVDIAIALLIEAGDAHREHVLNHGQVHRAFKVARVVVAVGRADIGFEFILRFARVELDDAARRIAAKQRALRSAQHLDLFKVEHRKAFQDGAFIRHVIVDQADRLGGVEIEIGVADAANVETRKGAAERAFGDHARHAGRQETHIRAGGFQRIQFLVGQGRDRDRHFLKVLFDALGRHRDRAEPGGGLFFCGLRQCGHAAGGEGDQADAGNKAAKIDLGGHGVTFARRAGSAHRCGFVWRGCLIPQGQGKRRSPAARVVKLRRKRRRASGATGA